MTSLRASLAASSLLLAAALAGCPGPGTTEDAGTDTGALGCDGCVGSLDAGTDAFAGEDAFSSDDAFAATDVFSADDAFSAADAFSATDTGVGTSGAFIARDCGPADGPALRLLMSEALDPSSCSHDPLRPSTQFYVHDLGGATLPPAAGATITSTVAASNGTATVCPGGRPPCRLSEDWTLTFVTYDDAAGATGQYVIRFDDGTMAMGNFAATRCESDPPICG
jgi:hypothetical protein